MLMEAFKSLDMAGEGLVGVESGVVGIEAGMLACMASGDAW